MKQAAKALIRDESGNILVLYRSQTHPHLAHDVDLPGGEIEHGESVEAGLMREIFEETGLDIHLEAHHQQHSWRSAWGQRQFLYEVSCVSPEVRISWEHSSYDWLAPEELVSHSAIDLFMHEVQAWLRA